MATTKDIRSVESHSNGEHILHSSEKLANSRLKSTESPEKNNTKTTRSGSYHLDSSANNSHGDNHYLVPKEPRENKSPHDKPTEKVKDPFDPNETKMAATNLKLPLKPSG